MSACASCIELSTERAAKLQVLEEAGATPESVRRALDAITGRACDPGGEIPDRDATAAWSVCCHQQEFPQRLMCFERAADRPSVIYGVGQRAALADVSAGPSVAIVGARRATAYGREVAYSLARECSESGITVVSGMALGIDGAAHRGALAAGGPTIAVLAGGPELAYPRSHRLLHEQIASRGCVVSELPPGSVAQRWGFVARNRIIAGLADLTVFVEGSEGSGARHTVSFSEDLGVEVGVVPGPVTSPMSRGPNAALAEGRAAVIRGIGDVRALLDLPTATIGDLPQLADVSPAAGRVLEAIAAGQRDPRAIAAGLADLEPREISRLLGELELAGRIRRAHGGEYELL